MSDLAMPDVAVTAPAPAGVPAESHRAHALLAWLGERLGEHFKVEMPSPGAPSLDGFRRYYVRQGGRRAVVRVTREFLRARNDDELSAVLMSASPTVLDLIRAGALHIDVDAHGSASALHPPCR